MDNRSIVFVIAAILLSLGLVMCTTANTNKEPQEVYRVYLKGKSLGLIESKKSLEQYIDKEQASIKKKYKVDKVYIPEDLDIEKEITYNEKILSTKQIYTKIKDISPFTIDGYTTTIKGLTKKNS